jgi:hypothetical protein
VQLVAISNKKLIEEKTSIGRKLRFHELGNGDVRKLLSSHSEELTDDDLFLDQQRAFEEADNEAEGRDDVQVKDLILKELEDIFRAVEFLKQNIMDADRNLDRSMQIRRDVDKALCVCQRVYEDSKKEKTVQSTLLKYFGRQ